jgi:hypothetical protein
MAIRGVSLLDMDSSKEFTFEFAIQTHGSTKLNVMYTNDPDSVKLCVAKFKQYLQDEKHKVAGLDLVPIHPSPDREQWITVAQVCVRGEVLVYHYCRAIRGSGAFTHFIGTADCTFATVESRKNATMLYDSAIWCKKLVDIQKQYKIIGNGQEEDSMVDLAAAIIDPYYANMKEDVDTKDLKRWEVPLNLAYITYAAKHAYACYDMYR